MMNSPPRAGNLLNAGRRLCLNIVPEGEAHGVFSKGQEVGTPDSFWTVLATLLLSVLLTFVNVANVNQLSAYDDDWNDLSSFREDLEAMGVETSSIGVAGRHRRSSQHHLHRRRRRARHPLIASVRPGWTHPLRDRGRAFSSEIEAIVKFAQDGGTVIVMEDFGYAGNIADAFGLKYGGWQLYDTVYATELDYNYIWMCVQESPCGMNGTELDLSTVDTHPRWGDDAETATHPCAPIDGETMSKEDAGVCAHHWVQTAPGQGVVEFNASYRVLLNNVTGIEVLPEGRGASTKSTSSRKRATKRRST